MAEHRANSPEEIPEADFLEQQTPVEVDDMSDEQDIPSGVSEGSEQANEADLVEQSVPLPVEEDYPHGPSDARLL
jgi:hypothetical protein